MSTAEARSPLLAESTLRAAAAGLSVGGEGALKTMSLLLKQDLQSAELVHALESEPMLAARVLKVANAPFYGRSDQVGSLPQAVSLLGLDAVRGAAAACCLDRLEPPKVGHLPGPAAFRRHSIAVALAARSVAQTFLPSLTSEAYMAGLLHDIGLPLLVKARPEAMAQFVPSETGGDAAMLAHEREMLGATHTQCAVALADLWHWPAWLRQALSGHHAATAHAVDLAACIGLAEKIADSVGAGFWPRTKDPALDDELQSAAQALGMTPEALAEITNSLLDDIANALAAQAA